jgi:hypothetical protein
VYIIIQGYSGHVFKEGVAAPDMGAGLRDLILLALIVILLGIFPQLLINRLYIIYI